MVAPTFPQERPACPRECPRTRFGTMVIALDPQGNSFGLWQAAQHTGVRLHNEPGALAWNEAAVDDPDAEPVPSVQERPRIAAVVPVSHRSG